MNATTREKQIERLGLPWAIPSQEAFRVSLSERELNVIVLHGLAALLTQGGGTSRVPVTTNVAVPTTAGGVTLRDSTTPRFVRIINQGPNPVTVTYGELVPVAATAGTTLATGDVDESPVPVSGKVRAISSGGASTVTFIEF